MPVKRNPKRKLTKYFFKCSSKSKLNLMKVRIITTSPIIAYGRPGYCSNCCMIQLSSVHKENKK